MKTILVVDDNPNMIKLISYFLREKRLNINSASNGKEALEIIDKEKVDFIFLDLMMPELDGFSVAHSLHENKKNITTVVLTSKEVTKEENNYLINLGVKKYINKEKITQQLIQDTINQYIRG